VPSSSEYWEAAAVVFLFSLGSYLEGRTMRKTGRHSRAAGDDARRRPSRRDGELQRFPPVRSKKAEVVVVKPGGKIPVDGDVVDGESAVNQAPVTGERVRPSHKADGDEVYAGTVNQEGALEIRTTGAGSDTTLERIIRRVEEAQEAQSPTESLIDRFAGTTRPASSR